MNAFLAALNWRFDQTPDNGLPNLVPESPVRSQQRGTIRFLDYLGLERQTDNPLLIVETKRPSAELPSTLEPAATYSEIVSRGLAGASLSGQWNQWLKDLSDYVLSAHNCALKVPKRVVITNGYWLIIFLDPTDAFLKGGTEGHSALSNRVKVISHKVETDFTNKILAQLGMLLVPIIFIAQARWSHRLLRSPMRTRDETIRVLTYNGGFWMPVIALGTVIGWKLFGSQTAENIVSGVIGLLFTAKAYDILHFTHGTGFWRQAWALGLPSLCVQLCFMVTTLILSFVLIGLGG